MRYSTCESRALRGGYGDFSGGGQNLERRDVEIPVLRNFEITNIKIKKDELFDIFIFVLLILFFRNYLNTQNI